MADFGQQILAFYSEIEFPGTLPEGISIMNPYRENPTAFKAVSRFYTRYYSDNNKRHLILGINPGRFGAGLTGIPFTDTIRLKEICGIQLEGVRSYETSSVFIYEMIDLYGGPEKFYGDFHFSSVSPLGFTALGKNGKEVNYNYYDSAELTKAIYDFAVTSLVKQLGFGIHRDVCFCLGTGKNFKFLQSLNDKFKFFERIEPLEHPRFIMQYRSKQKNEYLKAYIEKLGDRCC